MKPFNYYQPTEIVFGSGRIKEIGRIAAKFAQSCLLVTVPEFPAVAPLYKRVKDHLREAGLNVAHFDGVIPNPTTEAVSAGAKMAKEIGAGVVIGLGGGSSMDTAKAIAVEATHEGPAWDYLFFKKPPTEKTLPIVAVTTTSGTGSQTTPCAVITKTDEKCKSAIWHPNIFARVALVDPELILTLPRYITACTGFDAFAHAFEGYIASGANPYADTLALESMRLIARYLPRAVEDGSNIEAREAMAWADTMAGLVIACAGVTLPHGLGMQIGGHCPHVAHGEALAAIYPEFTRYTYVQATPKFATVGRIFNPGLSRVTDDEAARRCCEEIDAFLKRIGLWLSLQGLNVPEEEIARIADDGTILPDYKNNPRVATRDEMFEMLKASYMR